MSQNAMLTVGATVGALACAVGMKVASDPKRRVKAQSTREQLQADMETSYQSLRRAKGHLKQLYTVENPDDIMLLINKQQHELEELRNLFRQQEVRSWKTSWQKEQQGLVEVKLKQFFSDAEDNLSVVPPQFSQKFVLPDQVKVSVGSVLLVQLLKEIETAFSVVEDQPDRNQHQAALTRTETTVKGLEYRFSKDSEGIGIQTRVFFLHEFAQLVGFLVKIIRKHHSYVVADVEQAATKATLIMEMTDFQDTADLNELKRLMQTIPAAFEEQIQLHGKHDTDCTAYLKMAEGLERKQKILLAEITEDTETTHKKTAQLRDQYEVQYHRAKLVLDEERVEWEQQLHIKQQEQLVYKNSIAQLTNPAMMEDATLQLAKTLQQYINQTDASAAQKVSLITDKLRTVTVPHIHEKLVALLEQSGWSTETQRFNNDNIQFTGVHGMMHQLGVFMEEYREQTIGTKQLEIPALAHRIHMYEKDIVEVNNHLDVIELTQKKLDECYKDKQHQLDTIDTSYEGFQELMVDCVQCIQSLHACIASAVAHLNLEEAALQLHTSFWQWYKVTLSAAGYIQKHWACRRLHIKEDIKKAQLELPEKNERARIYQTLSKAAGGGGDQSPPDQEDPTVLERSIKYLKQVEIGYANNVIEWTAKGDELNEKESKFKSGDYVRKFVKSERYCYPQAEMKKEIEMFQCRNAFNNLIQDVKLLRKIVDEYVNPFSPSNVGVVRKHFTTLLASIAQDFNVLLHSKDTTSEAKMVENYLLPLRSAYEMLKQVMREFTDAIEGGQQHDAKLKNMISPSSSSTTSEMKDEAVATMLQRLNCDWDKLKRACRDHLEVNSALKVQQFLDNVEPQSPSNLQLHHHHHHHTNATTSSTSSSDDQFEEVSATTDMKHGTSQASHIQRVETFSDFSDPIDERSIFLPNSHTQSSPPPRSPSTSITSSTVNITMEDCQSNQ